MSQSTKVEALKDAKKQWAKDERGTGGLKSMRLKDFKHLSCENMLEILEEPALLTFDGEEKLVLMTVDQYFARVAPTVNPLRQPEMARINGRLFREVV